MQINWQSRRAARRMGFLILLAGLAADMKLCADTNPDTTDPLLDLFIKKGYVSQQEAEKVKAEADFLRTNGTAAMPPESKWKISNSIKNVELFGDVRVRYEDRTAKDPGGDEIELQRYRYALRFGLRGEALDNFYYGFRLETSSNPRSPFVTMGNVSQPSSSNPYYQGPYGKSTASIDLGQIYIGWRPEDWVDITLGKMPNPLYTTPMVWSQNINPEGAAERFKYAAGQAEFFANFGQFIYQDMNPVNSSGFLVSSGIGTDQDNIFQIAWQGGMTYRFTPKTSVKVGPAIYQYFNLKQSSTSSGTTLSPYYGDAYVGEGAYAGPGLGQLYSTYGYSGFPTPGFTSVNYPNNQVGLNDLLVLEVPFEVNFKISRWDARVFGDYAYNLNGKQRAEAAAAGYANYLKNGLPVGDTATISAFAPQTHDVKAYQIGLAVGSEGSLGLVNGTTSGKNAWELRTYWQHIEQYSLDPNLLDTDFFNGVENLEGIYTALSYGLGHNVIVTFRYGHASRINDTLGTGGSSQDIPQVNPINSYDLFQADLTLKF